MDGVTPYLSSGTVFRLRKTIATMRKARLRSASGASYGIGSSEEGKAERSSAGRGTACFPGAPRPEMHRSALRIGSRIRTLQWAGACFRQGFRFPAFQAFRFSGREQFETVSGGRSPYTRDGSNPRVL